MARQRHLVEDTLDELDRSPDLRVLCELLVRVLGDLDEEVAVGLRGREGVQQPGKPIGPPRLQVAASIAQRRQVRVVDGVQRTLLDVRVRCQRTSPSVPMLARSPMRALP